MRRSPSRSCARAPESEGTAHHDSAVTAGEVELVDRLDDERRLMADGSRRGPARLDHVGRRVNTIDIEPVGDPWHEQAPGAAPDIESRLSGGHVRAEEVDLGTAKVEVRPPPGDQPVMRAINP